MIGSPHNCIRVAAQEHAADLVVVARGGILDLRSIAARLSCPLLSIAVPA